MADRRNPWVPDLQQHMQPAIAPDNPWVRAAPNRHGVRRPDQAGAADSLPRPAAKAVSVPIPSSGFAASKARPDVAPLRGTLVDYDLVRRLRRELAESLAAHLRARPDLSRDEQRELCRAVLREPLREAGLDWARSGGVQWTRSMEEATGEAVMAALFGLGRLQPLLDDPEIENIEVNGCDQVWVCFADGSEQAVDPIADSDEELIEQLQLLAARSGASERTFTSATTGLDLRLDDGSRLAAMAWVTPRPQVVIRRHRVREVTLSDLVQFGTLDSALAAFLGAALRAGKNIVVTGLQNAGKTTLLRALAGEFEPMERFGTIEREYELLLHELPDRHPRVVPMEAREGSSERDVTGRRAGEVTLEELVRRALRMNLRRIIVGEVRDSEVLPMLQAMATGDGSMCTLHARTAAHAVDRLVTLCMAAGVGISDTFAYRLVAGSVDLIVHIDLVDERWIGGSRHRFVSQVLEVNGIGESNRPALTTVFVPGGDGRAVPGHTPSCLPELIRTGFDPSLLDEPNGAWSRPVRRVTTPTASVAARGARNGRLR